MAPARSASSAVPMICVPAARASAPSRRCRGARRRRAGPRSSWRRRRGARAAARSPGRGSRRCPRRTRPSGRCRATVKRLRLTCSVEPGRSPSSRASLSPTRIPCGPPAPARPAVMTSRRRKKPAGLGAEHDRRRLLLDALDDEQQRRGLGDVRAALQPRRQRRRQHRRRRVRHARLEDPEVRLAEMHQLARGALQPGADREQRDDRRHAEGDAQCGRGGACLAPREVGEHEPCHHVATLRAVPPEGRRFVVTTVIRGAPVGAMHGHGLRRRSAGRRMLMASPVFEPVGLRPVRIRAAVTAVAAASRPQMAGSRSQTLTRSTCSTAHGSAPPC